MGLTDSKEIQLVISVIFLLIYLLTVLGNICMILIIRLDVQLHTPMYFFLTHLSFLDLSYSTAITPKTLENLLTSSKNISYVGCFAQMYFFVLLAATECFLLSSMAYDRNTDDIEFIIFIFAGSTLLMSLITISASYMSILSTILKINSTLGKQKAFSTCASHILAVTIFYGTMIFTHLKSNKSFSLGKDQVASVFYTIVIPMLNPLIYSLRNKEVKCAVSRVMKKREKTLDT
ncbi:Olfactory receptor 8H2 [Microtus ochrogaster]|uniref:Olfactory receptor 8H2 n=1 Tax=Microtus ochrogaster TaxID=79684 RepID=A0A8J6G9S7_MICOH|nr:Olfactory receptor 8H2 [Microtus ochrogaster]